MVEKTKRLNSFDTCEKEEVGMKWSFKDGVLRVKGKAVECPKEVNGKEVRRIIVEEGTLEIKEDAFYDCTELAFIEFPDGLRKIGDYAVYNDCYCYAFFLPDSVEEIHDKSLGGDFSIFVTKNSKLLESLVKRCWEFHFVDERPIGDIDPFNLKEHLRFELDESGVLYVWDARVTKKEGLAIDCLYRIDANNVKKIVVEEGVKSIYEFSRKLPNVESVVLPDSLEMICRNSFHGYQKLKEVVFGKGLVIICSEAFSGCKSLREIQLPDGLRFISRAAFASSGIENVKVPDSVEYLSLGVFTGCKDLKEVQLPKHLIKCENELFNVCENEVKLPAGASKAVLLSEFKGYLRACFPNFGLGDVRSARLVYRFDDESYIRYSFTEKTFPEIPKTRDSFGCFV